MLAKTEKLTFPTARRTQRIRERIEVIVSGEMSDRTNFQGRYVLRHPWTGATACEPGSRYQASLPARFEKEAQNLASLTGWSLADIQARMESTGQPRRGTR